MTMPLNVKFSCEYYTYLCLFTVAVHPTSGPGDLIFGFLHHTIVFPEDSYLSPTRWIFQLQPVSHATCILSPLDGLVYKCPLLYGRVVVQSLFKQKKVKLIMGHFLHNF
jgi:hypothetical protein